MATRVNRPSAKSARQLFTSHGGRRTPRSTRFQPVVSNASATSFYGSRARYESRLLEQEEDHSDHWRPGETISPANARGFSEVYSDDDDPGSCQWNDVKAFITSEVAKIEQSMTEISQRIQNLEDNVGSLSKTVDGIISDGSVSSSSVGSTPSSNRRKRKSPLGLQSKIRAIHKCLDDDSQLHLEEPIDSAHNKKVVKALQDEIGTEYTVDVIRAGINTYRKSLKRNPKETETKKRARRSRQQRLWERRSKFVRSAADESEADEQAKWEEVKACMMSDEETLPDGKLARKRPCWRSEAFNDFVDMLDARADASLKTARKERVLSSPWKTATPSSCRDWMICSDPE